MLVFTKTGVVNFSDKNCRSRLCVCRSYICDVFVVYVVYDVYDVYVVFIRRSFFADIFCLVVLAHMSLVLFHDCPAPPCFRH